MTAESVGSASPARLGAPHPSPLPSRLVADLRTDHAGETGAVMIDRGILATTRDAAVRSFAQAHLATEAAHLAAIEQLLAPRHRSRLLPLWRAAGVDRAAGGVRHHRGRRALRRSPLHRADRGHRPTRPGSQEGILAGVAGAPARVQGRRNRSPRRCRRAPPPPRGPCIPRASLVDPRGRRGLARGGEDLLLDLSHDPRQANRDRRGRGIALRQVEDFPLSAVTTQPLMRQAPPVSCSSR